MQRNRFDRRAGQAAGDVRQPWLFLPDIDRHRGKRVHQRKNIRPAVNRRAGGLGDVFDVGRQLHDQRLVRQNLLDHRGQFLQTSGMGAEGQAIFHIRTRDIQLDGGNAIEPIHRRTSLDVIVKRMPGHIHDHRAGHFLQQRHLLGQKPIEADIGQSDRVQHPGADFNDARRLISDTLFARDGLGNERPESGKVHEVGVFKRVPAGARTSQGGIGKLKAGEIEGEIYHGESCMLRSTKRKEVLPP